MISTKKALCTEIYVLFIPICDKKWSFIPDAKATIEESKKDENEVSSTNRLNETVEEAAAPDTSMDSLNEAGQGDNSVVCNTPFYINLKSSIL